MTNITVSKGISNLAFKAIDHQKNSEQSLREKLREPFRKDDLEWRLQSCGQSGSGDIWALALVYVTSRAIQERLDDVVGCENWRNEFEVCDKGFMCGISIKINGEWVTKWDGSDTTQIESFKGGISGAMKRAGVQWGIGRYLYSLKERWVDCCMDRKMLNKPDWKKGYIKAQKIEFYWNIPELELWACHEDDNIFIGTKHQKQIKSYIVALGASLPDFKKAFNVQEASMIKKSEYNKCLDWIESNATKESGIKPVRLI